MIKDCISYFGKKSTKRGMLMLVNSSTYTSTIPSGVSGSLADDAWIALLVECIG